MLSETEYVTLAQTELRLLINALDQLESDDLDCELENDILTLELDGATYVINSHRAARQIWMAAERTAWHFDWNPEQSAWIAVKSGDELWQTIRRLLSPKLPQVEEALVRSSG